MNLQEILAALKKLQSKVDYNMALILFDDESGRITLDPTDPYSSENEPLFEFSSTEELIKYLKEN